MENKNPIFSIKNFRSFGEEGADFELAPITVLTGCNSAGKSSLVKALLLLSKQPDESTTYNCAGGQDQFFKEMALKEHTSCPSTTLILPTSLSLGRFDKLLNDKTSSKRMEMSYTLWSNYLNEMIRVRRIYKAREGDLVNYGELVSYSVEKLDETIIFKYSIGYDSCYVYETMNFDAIDEKYRQFRKKYECNGISEENIDEKLCEKIKKELAMKLEKEKSHIERIEKWNFTVGHLTRIQRNDSEQLINIDETLKYAFSSLINNEVVRPSFIKNVAYCDSSSAYIKRIYSIEDDNKLSKALRWLNEAIVKEKQEPYVCGQISMGTFVNRWIRKFEIGDEIKLEPTNEGLGVMVYLIKNGQKRLLADEGYGITQLVTLLLSIESKMAHFDGYGFEPEPSYICVEEPENHLHPKFQSLLADMFVEAYQKYNIHFIIETHSEYLIRKLQVMVADKEIKLSPNDVSINYVEKNEDGVSYNRQIKIKEDGRLHGSFGTGFYDEAGGLSRRLFMLND